MLLTPKSTEITLPEVHLLLPRYNLLLKQLLMRDVEKKAKSGGELTEIVNLDHHRYEDIPSRVQARKNDSQETWLEKTEVELLMKWKLKHGKFRPQLLALIASNSADAVKSTTTHAFATYEASNPAQSAAAITQLSKLKGVGPATASLILSVYDPTDAPFFSDELFRWVCWDERAGWDSKIKYDAKEYRMLCDGVEALRERLGVEGEGGKRVEAVELEKLAYVLGKCAVNKKLAAAIEKEVGMGQEGGDEEREREAEAAPSPSKRAKVGPHAASRPSQRQRALEGNTEAGDEGEDAGGKVVTRRTSQRRTRGGSGSGKNEAVADTAVTSKRKRKSNSDNL